MEYSLAIKEGFRKVNKNYQLLLIQTGVLILAFFLFFVIVGIPIIVAFSKIGLELPEAGLKELIGLILQKGLSGYKTIIITVAGSLLIYLVLSSLLFIYTIAATCGMLMGAIKSNESFSWGLFRHYGKTLFPGFLRLSLAGILIFIIISFIAGLVGGFTKGLSGGAGGDNFIKDFFDNLLNLISVLFTFSAIIIFMATFTYGAGFMILRKEKALQALKSSIKFIFFKNPGALLFYVLLSMGAIVVSLSFGLIGLVFKGVITFTLYQLVLSVIQIYINLLVLAGAFAYLGAEERSE